MEEFHVKMMLIDGLKYDIHHAVKMRFEGEWLCFITSGDQTEYIKSEYVKHMIWTKEKESE